MSKNILTKFGLRWLVSGLGLWIAASLLGPSRLSVGGKWTTVVVAGFFLALVNMFLKPLLIFLSLPVLLLTIGLFMLIVNGLLILIAGWIYSPLYVENLGVAIVAGLIIGAVNFLITRILKEYKT